MSERIDYEEGWRPVYANGEVGDIRYTKPILTQGYERLYLVNADEFDARRCETCKHFLSAGGFRSCQNPKLPNCGNLDVFPVPKPVFYCAYFERK